MYKYLVATEMLKKYLSKTQLKCKYDIFSFSVKFTVGSKILQMYEDSTL